MHTLSDKVRFVQRKLKPEEAFRTKKWMVLAEHLLAQAHIYIRQLNPANSHYTWITLGLLKTVFLTCEVRKNRYR